MQNYDPFSYMGENNIITKGITSHLFENVVMFSYSSTSVIYVINDITSAMKEYVNGFLPAHIFEIPSRLSVTYSTQPLDQS